MKDLHPSCASVPTDEAKRRALPWSVAQGVFNTIFALLTFCGSVFLLFLSELGLPKGQIGVVLSLFPFCGLLALGFAPWAARVGWKRTFLAAFGARKLVLAGLLLTPWVLARFGHAVALIFLVSIISAFAVLRALGETAYYPWSQEFVPNSVRGKYNAVSTVAGMAASALALLVAGQVIGRGAGPGVYLAILASGLVFGAIGVLLMLPVPGGAPRPEPARPGTHWANMHHALRDRNFMAYLGGMAGVTVGGLFLTAFLPLYVREQMLVPPGTVVRLDLMVLAGAVVASPFWGWATDRVGSRPVLLPAAALHALIPIGWLLLPRSGGALVWCGVLYFIYGVAANGVGIGAGRLLFNGVIPPEKSIAYTAIHYAWAGLLGGVTPLLAGAILSGCDGWHARVGTVLIDGYALLFLLAVLLLGVGWALYRRVRPDDRYTTREAVQLLSERTLRRVLLRPWR